MLDRYAAASRVNHEDRVEFDLGQVGIEVDLHRLRLGMPAQITLDAYPGTSYPARLTQISPIAAPGQYSQKIRAFSAIFAIESQGPELAPDLSAAVDLLPEEGARAAR